MVAASAIVTDQFRADAAHPAISRCIVGGGSKGVGDRGFFDRLREVGGRNLQKVGTTEVEGPRKEFIEEILFLQEEEQGHKRS